MSLSPQLSPQPVHPFQQYSLSLLQLNHKKCVHVSVFLMVQLLSNTISSSEHEKHTHMGAFFVLSCSPLAVPLLPWYQAWKRTHFGCVFMFDALLHMANMKTHHIWVFFMLSALPHTASMKTHPCLVCFPVWCPSTHFNGPPLYICITYYTYAALIYMYHLN